MAHSQIHFKLTNHDAFPPAHVLATGLTSSYTGLITSAICFDHLLDRDCAVLQLCEKSHHNGARGYFTSWCRAEGYPVEKLRYRTATPEDWRSEASVTKAIADTLAETDRDLLVFRDLSYLTTPLLPNDSWLSVAREVAANLQCPVVTAGSYGVHLAQRFDLQKEYAPARVLEVKAGNSLSAIIEDLKTGRRWNATARNVPGLLLFDITPEEKLAAVETVL